MILKGSQRGGAGQLAQYLLNPHNNDHVALHELRGFVADDLRGALAEVHAISKATHCEQYMFSLSLNPPKDAGLGINAFMDAVERAETALGLTGQPRAVVIHEKNGRRHLHVVWSRIDAEAMKAVNLPFFKNRLSELSKELYLEHGWELPEGHRTNGWKNPLNFTMAEWQQAQRLGLDPREIKQVFRQAWERSDNLASLRHALEEHGYFLARGDRRAFVALDINGEAFALARWAGIKTRDVNDRLGNPDALPGVDEVRKTIRARMSERLHGFIREDRQNQREELKPLLDERADMVAGHRAERQRLHKGQEERWRTETKARAGRFRRGLHALLDLLTGKTAAIRRENEREAYKGHLRDRDQREALFEAQVKERRVLQERMDAINRRHRQERMRLARRIVMVLRHAGERGHDSARHPRHRHPDLDLDR